MSNPRIALLGLLLSACADQPQPLSVEAPDAPSRTVAPAPAPGALVHVHAAGEGRALWPYTGVDFTGTPQDPINLVFVGEADPRNLRNVLLSLRGNRTGTPFQPFDCTWTDAIGTNQVTYGAVEGWSGSAVQLECGGYAPLRFHVRLFRLGEWTVANAHIDVLIPGTPDHQVLTWELAEQFLVFELARSGTLAAAPGQTGTINAVGSFREIPAVIYNALPVELRALTGGPLGDVAGAVPILTDGSATVLHLGGRGPAAPPRTSQAFALELGQVVPRPFCNAGGEYIRIAGPVRFRHVVTTSAAGTLSSQTHIDGRITAAPLDPLTGTFGAPLPAIVREQYAAGLSDHEGHTSMQQFQQLMRPGGTPQQLRVLLRAGPGGTTVYTRSEACGA